MKKIMMHPNPTRDLHLKNTRLIAAYLRAHGVEVTIPDDMVEEDIPVLRALPFENAIAGADMIISLGGDGSILHTARQAAEHAIPILGVNVGRMGYMAELEADELDAFGEILDGKYTVEERMMIDVSIRREHEIIYKNTGLNDVVITKTNRLKIIDLDIYADQFFISHYQGDGVVIATPTGSTAYSMSAGGPIVDPLAKNLTITPVCTHSLSAKPIILSPKRTISVQALTDTEGAIGVSVDGAPHLGLRYGDQILVAKSDYTTKLVRVRNKNFYDILCTKLSERRFDDN